MQLGPLSQYPFGQTGIMKPVGNPPRDHGMAQVPTSPPFTQYSGTDSISAISILASIIGLGLIFIY